MGKIRYDRYSSRQNYNYRLPKSDKYIERRSPHQVGKDIAKGETLQAGRMSSHTLAYAGTIGINEGRIKFFDKHLSMFPVDLMYGFYTMNKPENKLDVVIGEPIVGRQNSL